REPRRLDWWSIWARALRCCPPAWSPELSPLSLHDALPICLVISLLIYFILYFCIKKRYDMVLFYVISSSCFFLLPYILSFENVWSIVTMMQVIGVYGYCFICYILLRTFIHRYKKIRK